MVLIARDHGSRFTVHASRFTLHGGVARRTRDVGEEDD